MGSMHRGKPAAAAAYAQQGAELPWGPQSGHNCEPIVPAPVAWRPSVALRACRLCSAAPPLLRRLLPVAGWGAGQLENECRRGVWVPVSASAAAILARQAWAERQPDGMWHHIAQASMGRRAAGRLQLGWKAACCR